MRFPFIEDSHIMPSLNNKTRRTLRKTDTFIDNKTRRRSQ